jgi:hypothetical protein
MTGKSVSQILQDMCISYQNPAFTSFGFVQTSPIEVGTVVSGTKTFTWVTSNSGNVQPNTVSILDIT